jgi:hypothetical protein
MQIDYLKEGNEDCPLLRLSNGNHEDYVKLVKNISDLIENRRKSILVNDVEGIATQGLTLEFVLGKENLGIIEFDPKHFKCILNNEKWHKVRALLQGFIENSKNQYQWLDETSNISLLVTDDGKW